MNTDSMLFIIPARGGSKGIPGKNRKILAGKPLIGYSIEAALGVTSQKNICVTTDDPDIADIARSYGIDIPFMRPTELASDTAGSREVMLHAVDFYRDHLGVEYDTIVLLQPTSPLRTSDDIRGAISLYNDNTDMVVSGCAAECNPYYDLFETDDEGFLQISKGDGHFTRRQDVPPVWRYNGAVYVIRINSLRNYPLGKLPHRVIYPMPAEKSIDLDTMLDWKIAEMILSQEK